MACLFPQLAARKGANGSYRMLGAVTDRDRLLLIFNGFRQFDFVTQLPCGRCINCRLEYSRQWAVRCLHESQLHKDNCFITLTYSPEFLPEGETLVLDHFQKFMKRLRKRFGSGIRFFHCGEYGTVGRRPHYHAIIFGLDFLDKKLFKIINGCRLYTSEILSELWPFGFSTVGSVTFDSAAYVSRYILKKINGDSAVDHYSFYDVQTGEIFQKKPEYTTMSRRPGIAANWVKKYSSSVYPRDEVVVRGRIMKPPKYYDSQYEHLGGDIEVIKKLRSSAAFEREKKACENWEDRLIIKRKLAAMRVSRLPRSLE